ncbi:hypothetical protein [uncultured Stenotrophomonas sp.]|uniref:hypothetical protein n=1 Tax=uncultured Stenotrophomonas sp. TaxID=165438 RepID=UPI0028E1DCB2|nr:hypothetical protein [uncultured Stenotrophomonas sp.]
MSRERPILFNGPMVHAILAGQKTQTRRAVKGEGLEWLGPGMFTPEYVADPGNNLCSFGKPGDRLWVRETWGVGSRPDPWGGYDGIEYRADECGLEAGDDLPCHKVETPADVCLGDYRAGWMPSIHMPRWACRLVLEITEVRVERLQAISEADVCAEGIEVHNDDGVTYYGPYGHGDARPEIAFRDLWTSTGGDWDGNPWVWVIEFKVVTP